MTPNIRPLVAGNWKMNGLSGSLAELDAIAAGVDAAAAMDVLICLPATLIERAARRVGTSTVLIGGEDCHANEAGAHTGDVSAEMIRDCGASHVIVGHSERRTDHGESDSDVAAKAKAAWRAGLAAIICIGETRAEREEGRALDVLSRQVEGSVPAEASAESTVVAYEPVWAIGTGLTPSNEDIADAHAHIRAALEKRLGAETGKMRILYGGSVKPGNAAEILSIANVDGALVGGASLKAGDFLGIVAGCAQG